MPHRAKNTPLQFNSIGEKLSVKADLAIYGRIFDVYGNCMSVTIMHRQKIDFNFCYVDRSFLKSSHIIMDVITF